VTHVAFVGASLAFAGVFGFACGLTGRDRARFLAESGESAGRLDRWLIP
jgi:hypothetical protein